MTIAGSQWPQRWFGRNTARHHHVLTLSGGRLTGFRAHDQRRAMLSPGLVDLQVNGFAGVDFNDAALTADALDHALGAMLRTGVTSCLPTLITASEDLLAARFAALDAAVAGSRLGGVMVPGYHLEGPFLNPAAGYAGCHPPEAMIEADPNLLRRLATGLRRPILLLTLAPEREGAAALIGWARARGTLVAIGHSAARSAEVAQAASLGAVLSTHLGNGLPHLLPKFDNPLLAQLAEDRLSASFIADGIHVPAFALAAMMRAKGLARTILVTDATSAAAAPAGMYELAGMAIARAADGSVRVPGASVLAGSSLELDQAVRNVVGWGIATAREAVGLASANPRALLAPALAAHGVRLAESSIEWSDELRSLSVRADGAAWGAS
jgi:N-acetylglucosamine-6-phosphate deacetylase